MGFEEQAIAVAIILTTINSVYLVVGLETGTTLVTNADTFNQLPSDISDLGVSGVTGETNLDTNSTSSLTTQSNKEDLPFFDVLVPSGVALVNIISGLLFSWISALQIIGLPNLIILLVAVPVSIVQIVGIFAILGKILSVIPFFGGS